MNKFDHHEEMICTNVPKLMANMSKINNAVWCHDALSLVI